MAVKACTLWPTVTESGLEVCSIVLEKLLNDVNLWR